ncbi:MAG: MotE family protein [Pseudomonadota bacterium]
MTLASTVPSGVVVAQANQVDGVDTAIAYCTNLADEASDARFARQAAKLEAMEAAVQDRLSALEAKRAEYQSWLERRQAFLDRAQDSLVSIYAGMRPDSASEQLAAMDELTAAAIVAKLAPRAASAVLNEMATDKAARLATIMSGMARENDNMANAG